MTFLLSEHGWLDPMAHGRDQLMARRHRVIGIRYRSVLEVLLCIGRHCIGK